ncbi:MAG: primosomal protein N' [Rhodospirillaceae bacterium]|jgi:primosomal protein N' (replication factor Y)|nr:primosomal protein N' [Rhodospirillaceae bacterium]
MSITTDDFQNQSSDVFLSGDLVRVLLPLPITGTYDYSVGPNQQLQAGDIVEVPLKNRHIYGVVWGIANGNFDKHRFISRRLDLLPLPLVSRQLVDWVATYTISSPGSVLKMVMNTSIVFKPMPLDQIALVTAVPTPINIKITEARRRVLNVAIKPLLMTELIRQSNVSASVIRGLVKAGAINRVVVSRRIVNAFPNWQHAGFPLSNDQMIVASKLCCKLVNEFSVNLLEGVTGSGKTEVYFEAIAEVLKQGHQILVLLPEISMSLQWLSRFERRFGALPIEWHSELSLTLRRDYWHAVANGSARVIVGARSALYLPYPDLGLIIVDEEHDASFKQEADLYHNNVIYHARDMAVARAFLGKIPIILASATPSLETQINVKNGRYGKVCLSNRYGDASMPNLDIIDMRLYTLSRQSWLSPPLVTAIEDALSNREQAMLFLNRRGYAPLTLCRKCGFRLKCPRCTACLVDHRQIGKLQCHHCGYLMFKPTTCNQCNDENSFVACGPGVERLVEDVAVKFPFARTRIMTSDTPNNIRAVRELIVDMERYEIDLLIGTQVMAKGHHFPLLTLVGVIDADQGMVGGDLRATERTFQLLSQVSGRSGRETHKGRVLLQTYQPESKVMQALISGNKEQFYHVEAEDRRISNMPPFGKLVALIISGYNLVDVEHIAIQLFHLAPKCENICVLGPVLAPLAMVNDRHRMRLLVKASNTIKIQDVVRQWISKICPLNGVLIQIDVDPYSFV